MLALTRALENTVHACVNVSTVLSQSTFQRYKFIQHLCDDILRDVSIEYIFSYIAIEAYFLVTFFFICDENERGRPKEVWMNYVKEGYS